MKPISTENTPELTLQHQLLASITNSWMAQAAYAAIELHIPDFLEETPSTAEQLAQKTGADSKSLYRLLRALSAMGVCTQSGTDIFTLTPTGKLLTENHPNSLRYWIIWWGTNLWQTWGNLLYSVKTGKSAREFLTKQHGFAHLEEDPKQAKIFNRALEELTRMAAVDIVNSIDFSVYNTVADIGGGYGELLYTILKEHNHCNGILFDLPHTMKEAKERFKQKGLHTRCKFIEGDFFKSIPKMADAYVFKSVIHDWNDAESLHILKTCRDCMPKHAHLLLAEQILPNQFENSFVHQSLARSDLTMLAAHGAGERTKNEFRELVHKSGFNILDIVPAGLTFSVIKAIPA